MRWKTEHLQFLRTGYATLTGPELLRDLNARFGLAATWAALRSTLRREHITCGRMTGKTRGRYLVVNREQAQFIREKYPVLPRADLLAEFNHRFEAALTTGQLRAFITNHHIKSGRTGCFEKGATSWNKGVKGYMGPNVTSYKKGDKPANLKPLGTERITRDGYIEVKIIERNPYTGTPTRYKLKHVHIWERERGPVPKGHAVVFIDGKKLNCAPDNLMLVTRAELLRLNQYRYAGQLPEVKPSVLALVKLEVKTFGLRKEA